MKDDRVYLRHILRCVSRIQQYTAAGRDSFFSSPLIQDASIRNLERFVERGRKGGPFGQHPAFGMLSTHEWGRFVYVHSDHHLRQFGV